MVVKVLVMKNAHVKYESSAFSDLEAMTKVIYFEVCKNSRSRSQGQKLWYGVKVLSQEMHMWNMKALTMCILV